MKRILLSLIFCIPVFSMEITKIDSAAFHASERLGKIKLYETREGFSVKHNGILHQVKNHEVDALLAKVHTKKCLAQFLAAGYITIDKLEDGNFKLVGKVRGNGGGGWGAHIGFLTGKFVTYAATQAVILTASAAISVVNPIAGGAFYYAATSTSAPFVETASNVVGLSVGLAGAVATGPI